MHVTCGSWLGRVCNAEAQNNLLVPIPDRAYSWAHPALPYTNFIIISYSDLPPRCERSNLVQDWWDRIRPEVCSFKSRLTSYNSRAPSDSRSKREGMGMSIFCLVFVLKA